MRHPLLVVIAIAGVTCAAVLLVPVQHAGAANPACPEGTPGELFTLSRTVVPIGVPAVRTFQIDKGGEKVAIANLAVVAPPGYDGVRVKSKAGYALRLRAPQQGSFEVHVTWTATYDDGSGPITCDASTTMTLNATTGSPLPVFAPRWNKDGGYGSPIGWPWGCKADSDPMPRTLTIRWEVDARTLPLFFRGGKPPFRFKFHPKTLTASTADPCDPQQTGGFTRKHLKKPGKLSVFIGGNYITGSGGFALQFTGIYRDARKQGYLHPLHVEVLLREGSRVLVDEKMCAFDRYGWQRAKGKNVICWW